MRIRHSPSGGSLEDGTRLLIEEPLPSSASNSHQSVLMRTQRRILHRYGQWVVGLLIFLLVVSFISLQRNLSAIERLSGGPYNPSPLSIPERKPDGSLAHQIAVVTDLDHDSKNDDGKWMSYYKRGILTVSPSYDSVFVEWAEGHDVKLRTEIAAGGRAMELSDLVAFNQRLLTIDDRTGLIYEIIEDKAIPWVFLDDGPGNVTKPLKGEWMTVKDEELIVGGLGKEWSTPEGVFVNDHPMWIKILDRTGRVRHENWAENFKKLRKACGISSEGYMVHEAVQWSAFHEKWFFLPRRASSERYNDAADERRGTNMLIIADEHFNSISMVRVGKGIYEGTKGFSAFQFVPGTKDQLIVALKSEEINGSPSASHITVFDIYGTEVMSDQQLPGKYKFEGLAFI